MVPSRQTSLNKMNMFYKSLLMNRVYKDDALPGIIYPLLRLGLVSPHFQNMVNDHYQLRLNMFSPRAYDLGQIAYTLTCSHVFGDDRPREIITYWRRPTDEEGKYNDKSKFFRVCYRIVFADAEITDVSHADYEQISLATIVLDK